VGAPEIIAGDEASFQAAVGPERAKLLAHCYRMTGSLSDAEDALQEGLLRAWRGLDGFDGRSRFTTWLYRVVTNACLTLVERRPQRTLPLDTGFPSEDPADAAGPPVAEAEWLGPFPDDAYEDRETLELAYVAALQHLPPNGRAALLLTEVLGYSAQEAAAMLETSTASLNSALQRARKAVAENVPPVTQQATLRALGDAELNAAVGRFLAAMDAADVDGVIALLAEDATWSMPPQPAYFRGHAAIASFLTENPFKWFEWRHRPIRLNGQPAGAAWTRTEDGRWLAHALNVIEFREDRISAVISFLDVTRRGVDDFTPITGLFEQLGLPAEL
jgi:RNA polymerase sigma-70 factor (ECF subfamily)